MGRSHNFRRSATTGSSKAPSREATEQTSMTGSLIRITLIALALVQASLAHAGSSNSLIDISADGAMLATANHDNGSVSIVDLASGKLLREIAVGKKLEGVSFLGGSHSLAATAYADDVVVLVDADSGTILKTVPVFDEPYGVVSTRDGAKAYVTLEYPGQVIEIDTASGTISRTLAAGEFVRGIALAADESRLFVTEYYTAAVVAIDLASGKVVDRWQGVPSENLARQIAVHPRRPKAYVPHIRSRVNVN